MRSLMLESMLGYFYGELPHAEHADLKMTIENDQDMKEQFDMLREGIEALGQLSYSPSDKTLRAVMDYAVRSASC